jgi:hypothetical protein
MISDEVRTYLMANDFDNVYVNYMPDVDTPVIVIYDEAAPVLFESVGLSSDQAGIQILVRSTTGAGDTTQDIYNLLVGFRNNVLEADGYLITQISPQQYPARVDVDDRNRHTWSVHFVVRYTNNTTNRS